jgi:hypothetical protein
MSKIIMRSLKAWPTVAAFIAAYATTLPAGAQQPPRLEKLEEGEPPAVTIRKPEQERKITEKRAPGGKVKEVKVTTGKSTYYLKPNDPVGSGLPGDTQSNTTRPAQWEVLEFDASRTKEAKEAAETHTAPAPRPPQVPQPPAKK